MVILSADGPIEDRDFKSGTKISRSIRLVTLWLPLNMNLQIAILLALNM